MIQSSLCTKGFAIVSSRNAAFTSINWPDAGTPIMGVSDSLCLARLQGGAISDCWTPLMTANFNIVMTREAIHRCCSSRQACHLMHTSANCIAGTLPLLFHRNTLNCHLAAIGASKFKFPLAPYIMILAVLVLGSGSAANPGCRRGRTYKPQCKSLQPQGPCKFSGGRFPTS